MKLSNIKRMTLWMVIAGAIGPAVGMFFGIFGLPMTIFMVVAISLSPIWMLWWGLAALAKKMNGQT